MKSISLVALALFLTAGTAHAQQRPATSAPMPTPMPAPVVTPAPLPAPDVQEVPSQTPASANELECRVLTGRVTDMFDHPLTGATVMLRSHTKGFSVDAFITNAEGKYIVTSKQPIPRNTMLEITAGGYNTFVLPLENCRPIEASLEPLPGTRFKNDGRIKKTSASGKIH
ncbi:carboxypeptidase-like regulatory domain-containing protein [Hymenobacter negativus]|uniref:Carboxypeptidase regulatory-like domain-containing protein n=1 Tax=Hymenobacter negativus TaxID=2795026 RepID=A0ABS3QKC9_9BACT|nr:carboxypeptidase-like regulatory domain-containing protein [Hymenobacter negativus]MBO2011687.1 carboxypeptidase regulatory-like domain-containing protein [Hymenobacter negativus]